MSATIRRSGGPVRRVATRRKPAKPTLRQRLLGWLPVSEAALRRAAMLAVLLACGGVAVAAASWIGVPAMLGDAVADVAGRAGLRVEQIEVTGLKRMDLMTVNAVALDQKSLAMPAVDLAGVRDRLLRYGWVADAHVSRRLPDTLLIHIDERTPAAVWQDEGQLTLIDASGVLLEPVDRDRMPGLPLVIGPGADKQAAGYHALLAAAPALARHVRAATWVGDRRWDLTLDTGEVLALPEGDRESAVAVAKFAAMADEQHLLGRGFLRFDLRDPSRMVVRRPDGAEAFADPGGRPAPAQGARDGHGQGGTDQG